MAINDILVIGAGISGLSMAKYAADAGFRVLVLEQENRPGGCIHSYLFTDDKFEGFWLELGAHSCFSSYSNLIPILESLKILSCFKKRAKLSFLIFHDNKIRSIPSQIYIPELLIAPFRFLTLIKAGRSVSDYYGRILGRRNYTAVFEPAFNAVICQPASDYPAESLFQSRPRTQYRKDLPRSFTFPDGLQTIVYSLSKNPGICIKLGSKVLDIQRDGKCFIVQTDNAEYTARAICLATPVAIASGLLHKISPVVAATLARVDTAVVETTGVVLNLKQVQLPKMSGLIGRDVTFYSMVSRDTVPDSSFRGFTFHFRPGILDTDGKLDYIAKVLRVPRDMLDQVNSISKVNYLPALRLGYKDIVRKVDIALSGSGLSLTGNYFTGVSIEDCTYRSRTEFERLQGEIL